jgi:transposase
MSRRGAARRFGIAVSTAIKLVDQWRRTGDIRPRRQGGDHRSQPIEAHAGEILALVEETPDLTLAEIAEQLERVHGLRVSQSAVWRLFARHGLTFKKNRARQRTAAA